MLHATRVGRNAATVGDRSHPYAPGCMATVGELRESIEQRLRELLDEAGESAL
jgi:hypothetical protein